MASRDDGGNAQEVALVGVNGWRNAAELTNRRLIVNDAEAWGLSAITAAWSDTDVYINTMENMVPSADGMGMQYLGAAHDMLQLRFSTVDGDTRGIDIYSEADATFSPVVTHLGNWLSYLRDLPGNPLENTLPLGEVRLSVNRAAPSIGVAILGAQFLTILPRDPFTQTYDRGQQTFREDILPVLLQWLPWLSGAAPWTRMMLTMLTRSLGRRLRRQIGRRRAPDELVDPIQIELPLYGAMRQHGAQLLLAPGSPDFAPVALEFVDTDPADVTVIGNILWSKWDIAFQSAK